MMKRIKVFLGGYVNYLNAQNINCRALSEHLDRERFRVMTLLSPIPNAMDFERTPGVKYIQGYRPMRLFQYYVWFRGVAWADVAYLPKGELPRYCHAVAKLFRTKIFCTLEGRISETDLSKIPEGRRAAYLDSYHLYYPHLYAITKFLVGDVGRRRGYRFASEVLYLGVESHKFLNLEKHTDGLRNVVFIGNKLPTKNIFDFIEASRVFQDVQFHIVGDNLLRNGTIDEYIEQNHLSNVTYHGRLDHTHLSRLLSTMDLMYFPSRSEGFPKVHLETACAGVPTICYGDYGAEEWITSGLDGFVVETREEAFAVIRDLKEHPEKLEPLSRNAVELGRRFDWAVLVEKWTVTCERALNRFPIFLFGIMIAPCFYKKDDIKIGWIPVAISVAYIAFFFALVNLMHFSIPDFLYRYLLGVLGISVIIIWTEIRSKNALCVISVPLKSIGRITFETYIVHVIIKEVIDVNVLWQSLPVWCWYLIIFTLTIPLAMLLRNCVDLLKFK